MPDKVIHVLIIEDNVADARLVELLLEEAASSSFRCTHQVSLQGALQCLGLSDFSCDVVLLDLFLPDAEGLKGLIALVARYPRMPVIVHSGCNDEEMAMHAMKNGAQDFLVKGQGDGYLLARTLRYAVERKQATDRVRFILTHDNITGLPNRLLMIDYLTDILSKTQGGREAGAVFSIGIDQFRMLNDALGYSVGDRLSCHVAHTIASCVRKHRDFLAHFGGDGFVIASPGLIQRQEIENMAERILAALAQPFRAEDRELFVSASIGVVLYPTQGNRYEVLLDHAHTAMHEARQCGGNHYRFYEETLQRDTQERFDLAMDLRVALANNQLRLHYQPIVDLSLQCVTSVEGLLRWSRSASEISPAYFIPIAEQMGMISTLGEWVLRAACIQNRVLHHAGLPTVKMAINVSPLQLRQKNLLPTFQRILQEHEIAPHHIELEFTENILIQDQPYILTVLHQMHEMGMRIIIDDFGVGYSSLSYLRRMPVDAIKIDQSFIQHVTTDAHSAAVVRAVLMLANSLNISVIAEGVETFAQMQFLRAEGCHQMQGYLFSHPVPHDTLVPLLSEQQRIPHLTE